jgi:voltage-gated potassium channel
MTLRERLSYYLDNLEHPIGLGINLAILALILLSLGIFVTETYPISAGLQFWLHSLDLAILGIFILEYLVRLWCSEQRLKFVFSLLSVVDLMAVLPIFVLGFDSRFFRIFRWFRILRIIRILEFKQGFFGIQKTDRIIFIRIFLTLFSIVFVYAGLIYQVEHTTNPEVFRYFFDALYFAIVTMTTVGFGDVVPMSENGRIITVLMIVTGVILLPLQISDLTKALLKNKDYQNNPCPGCGLALHDLDANFCKICGTPIRGKN